MFILECQHDQNKFLFETLHNKWSFLLGISSFFVQWNYVISICVTASKPIFDARNFSSKLQISMHWCTPTRSTCVYCGLVASVGNSEISFDCWHWLSASSIGYIWVHQSIGCQRVVNILASSSKFLWMFDRLHSTISTRYFSSNKVVMSWFSSFNISLGRFYSKPFPARIIFKRTI